MGLQHFKKVVLTDQRLIPDFGAGEGSYPQNKLSLKCFEKGRIVFKYVFGATLQSIFQSFLNLSDKANGALELGLRWIFNKCQVIRDHQSVLYQKFAGFDVNQILRSPSLLNKITTHR